VVERRVLRRGFASKAEEVMGEKTHNKELHNLSYLLDIVSTVKSGGYDGQSI
jgi:hypothetical protein